MAVLTLWPGLNLTTEEQTRRNQTQKMRMGKQLVMVLTKVVVITADHASESSCLLHQNKHVDRSLMGCLEGIL